MTDTEPASVPAVPSARAPSAPTPTLALALALLALGPGAAGALVHDRLPGDDLGGATSLPVAVPIGEDAGGPVRDAAPAAAPAPPSRTVSADPA